jgi:hypothetical protein
MSADLLQNLNRAAQIGDIGRRRIDLFDAGHAVLVADPQPSFERLSPSLRSNAVIRPAGSPSPRPCCGCLRPSNSNTCGAAPSADPLHMTIAWDAIGCHHRERSEALKPRTRPRLSLCNATQRMGLPTVFRNASLLRQQRSFFKRSVANAEESRCCSGLPRLKDALP